MIRTLSETIALFKTYEDDFTTKAERETDPLKREFYKGKADAYYLARYELEHNTVNPDIWG